MPMAIILGMVVSYHKGLIPIKPHDPLITWSVVQDHVTN